MPPPAAIWLVRHAPTAWTGVRYCGRADPPLSAAGTVAARALAERLADRLAGAPTIVTSPARRARATAKAIRAVSGGPPPRLDEALLEVDFGAIEGLTWGDVEATHPEIAAALRAGQAVDWPGGETDRSVRDRAAAAWRWAAADDARRGPLVIVSHGVVIRALLVAAGTSVKPGAVLPAASAVGLARTADRWQEVARLEAGVAR